MEGRESRDRLRPVTERVKSEKQRLTVSVDREVLREARRLASARGTTVPEMVRQYLAGLDVGSGARSEAAAFLTRSMRESAGQGADWNFDRDELYADRIR